MLSIKNRPGTMTCLNFGYSLGSLVLLETGKSDATRARYVNAKEPWSSLRDIFIEMCQEGRDLVIETYSITGIKNEIAVTFRRLVQYCLSSSPEMTGRERGLRGEKFLLVLVFLLFLFVLLF
jgi:hypothetical protein